MNKHDDEPVDPAVAGTWERLLKLARGSAEVMEVLLPVAAGLTRDELARLLARAAGSRDTDPPDAMEQVWKLLGVVPHNRYEDLRRRYETLRGRVEEAESGLRELRRIMEQQDRQAEARQALDSWGGLLRRTLAAQAELLRSVTGGVPEQGGALLPPGAEPAKPEPAKPALRPRAGRRRVPPGIQKASRSRR